MKTRPQTFTAAGVGFATTALTASLLSATPPGWADTSFASTGYLSQVPVPGILVTNALGQVMLKGNVHVLSVQASDPRATGRLQAHMDLAYQTNGTAQFCGPVYLEIGTWQNQTNFTPTGGLWVMNYRGVAQADGRDQLALAGYGVGGNIDGLRVEGTGTKDPGTTFDPAIPYLFSGVIRPAPVSVTATIDLTKAAGWGDVSLPPDSSLSVVNGQLTVQAAWPGKRTAYLWDTGAWLSPMTAWSVTSRRTLEARVDLVSLSGASAIVNLALYHDRGQGYWMGKAGDYISLGKQNGNLSFFTCEKVLTHNTNEVLVLVLTPSGQDVLLTARVLDRGHGGVVVYETSFLDTPSSDPSLTLDRVKEITGMNLTGIVPDPTGAPWTSGTSPTLVLLQYTDGALPGVQATFANFELRTSDVPLPSISRPVQITVPCADGVSYCLESASSLNGPWLPVYLQAPPGVQSFTVPVTQDTEFFRTQVAP